MLRTSNWNLTSRLTWTSLYDGRRRIGKREKEIMRFIVKREAEKTTARIEGRETGNQKRKEAQNKRKRGGKEKGTSRRVVLLLLLSTPMRLRSLLLSLLRSELFAVSAVEHLVPTLDALWSTLDALVLASTDDDGERLALVLGETFAHRLFDLADFLAFGHVVVAEEREKRRTNKGGREKENRGVDISNGVRMDEAWALGGERGESRLT
jgi:hypothetical protein